MRFIKKRIVEDGEVVFETLLGACVGRIREWRHYTLSIVPTTTPSERRTSCPTTGLWRNFQFVLIEVDQFLGDDRRETAAELAGIVD